MLWRQPLRSISWKQPKEGMTSPLKILTFKWASPIQSEVLCPPRWRHFLFFSGHVWCDRRMVENHTCVTFNKQNRTFVSNLQPFIFFLANDHNFRCTNKTTCQKQKENGCGTKLPNLSTSSKSKKWYWVQQPIFYLDQLTRITISFREISSWLERPTLNGHSHEHLQVDMALL